MLILASKSPRRSALLEEIDMRFEVIPSRYDEKHDISDDPISLALLHATGKAMDVFERTKDRGNDVILGVDTLVCVKGEILGKPRDEADAKKMLKKLSGEEHTVVSGLCLIRVMDGKTLTHAEATIVRFKNLSDGEIDAYILSGEWSDKAGAYAIQGGAADFVDEVRGDLSNVIGLPCEIFQQLYDKLICEA